MKSIYAKSRDNARTPMQWSSGENAGFTAGTPWIEINPNYSEINAEAQRQDPDSVFSWYRTLVRLRKEYPVFVEGTFELLMEEDEQVFAYIRENDDSRMLVCANFTGTPAACPLLDGWKDGEMLVHNYKDEVETELKPYEAVVVLKRK